MKRFLVVSVLSILSGPMVLAQGIPDALPGDDACQTDADCARFGEGWTCAPDLGSGEYLCKYAPPAQPPTPTPTPSPIAQQDSGFLPKLDQIQKYGPGSVIRYRSRWKLPADWYGKTWAIRLTGGNLPSSGSLIPVFNREGFVNRTLQQAFDQGHFLDRQAREVLVTIAPTDTWKLVPGSYQLDIVADGVPQGSLGGFRLGDTECLILNGSGELRNTAVTFIGDSKEQSSVGFTDGEWQTYLYGEIWPPQGMARRENDATIDNYRDRINVQAIRKLRELDCHSGGPGDRFSCDKVAAQGIVNDLCPHDDARDPTMAIVARPPDGKDGDEYGWKPHATFAMSPPYLGMWPHVFGLEDKEDTIMLTAGSGGAVALHELGHAFGQLPDYYCLYDDNDPNKCSQHPSAMCNSSEYFKNLLQSRDKAAMVHFLNRNSCDIRSIQLSLPFPSPNGGDGCTRIVFFIDYLSPTSAPCYVSFAVVNVQGQTVWSTTSYDPLPANPVVDGRSVPYVLGYVENPALSSYWPPACVADPRHCAKGPGFAGLNDLGEPVASGEYYLHAYANGSIAASQKFVWYGHEATRGCVPPGGNENSYDNWHASRIPVGSWEDTVQRLVVPQTTSVPSPSLN